MAEYHNAVSDKLVVSFFPESTFYSVYSKDNNIKHCEILTGSSNIPASISNSIFSKTTCISTAQNFVLASLSDANSETYFKLNFDTFDKLQEDKLENLNVVHNLNSSVLHITSNLVNAEVVSDVSLIYKKLLQKGCQNAVYFYTIGNVVTIFCIKEGTLQIANRYPADNVDELFYYVMLLVEQMEIQIEKIHFECLATKGRHETYHALFKNYLPTLNLTNISTDSSFLPSEHHDLKSEFLQATYFAQCVL